jgi:hypothetical protein
VAPQDATQDKAHPAHHHGLDKLITLHSALYVFGMESGLVRSSIG